MKKHNAPVLILALMMLAQTAFATTSTRFNLHFKGRLIQPSGVPLTMAAVVFNLRVKNSDASCILYSETQMVNVQNGFFDVNLGDGVRTDVGTYLFNQIFITGTDLSSTCAGYIVQSDKDMQVQISFDTGSEQVDLDPQPLKAVPFVYNSFNATQALDSAALNSLPVTDLMTAAGATASNLATSRNLSIANFKTLTSYLAGNSPAQTPVGIGTLSSTQVSTMQGSGELTAGQIWYNSTDHNIYYYNGTTTTIMSYVNDIAAGTGVLESTSDRQDSLSLDVGTGANQILQVGAGNKLPAVDASQLTNINLTNIPGTIPLDKGGTGLSAIGTANQILGMNSAGSGAEYKTLSGANGIGVAVSGNTITISNPTALYSVTNMTASSPLSIATGSSTPVVSITNGASVGQTIVWDGANWNVTKAPYGKVVNNAGLSPWPAASCATGEVAVWHSSTDTSVAAAQRDTFTCEPLMITASQLSGVVDPSNVPDLDASKITSGTLPVSLGGIGVSNIVAGDANKVLGINAAGDSRELKTIVAGSGMTITNNAGEINIAGNVTNGTVTNIAGGTGVLGGPITSTGTLSLNTAQGTSVAANQYVQLDSSSRLPTADGQNLTNLNPNNLSSAITVAEGGIGQTSLGAANTVLGINAGATGSEFKGIVAGTGMTVTSTAGGIQISPNASAGTVSTFSASSIYNVTSTPSLTPSVAFVNGSSTGNAFRWNSGWSNNGFLKYTDIVNNSSASPWPAACTSGTALVWNSTTDLFSCQTFTLSDANLNLSTTQSAGTFFAAPTSSAGTPSFRAIASTDLATVAILQGGNSLGAVASIGVNDANALQIETNSSPRVYVDGSGRVGIGTTPTDSALEVAGQMRFTSTPSTSSATIDWSTGNNQITTLSCQNFTFQNMRDGGMYTLIVTGTTAGYCQFAQTTPDALTYASNFKFYPAESTTSGLYVAAGVATIFHFIRAGNTVYVNWLTGY